MHAMHLLNDGPHCNELSCLLSDKQQLLLHCICGRVPVQMQDRRRGERNTVGKGERERGKREGVEREVREGGGGEGGKR